VSNVNNLREGVIGTREGAVPEHPGKCGCGFDFDEDLDLVQGLSMRRITHTQAVEAESGVAVTISGYIDVGIVVVVER